MAQITWTNEALRWLEDIFEYIAADNPDAASRTVEAIFGFGPRKAQTRSYWIPDIAKAFPDSAPR
jgi:plasmid stabilization system protein ParE